MSVRVAVLAPPLGRVGPEDPAFEAFFRLARSLGAALEPAPRIDDGALRGCGALLLGDPVEDLPAASAAAVRAFIAGGGSLLLANSDPARRFPGVLPPPLSAGLRLRARRPGGGHLSLQPLSADGVTAPAVASLLLPEALVAGAAGLRPWSPWAAAAGWSRGWLARLLGRDRERVVADLPLGAGRLVYVGATELLAGPPELLAWIVARWLRFADSEVPRRMRRAQRHRLLHGYPMAPLMTTGVPDAEVGRLATALTTTQRRAIVGVLPHPFCNPQVKGCGFCTFPHEDYSRPRAHELAVAVAAEIAAGTANGPPRPVEAVYLGGGTANLTPPEDLALLCGALARRFDLRDAEVTLEGVPVYFLAKRPRPLDVLREALPDCSLRLSMGVQTFDPAWLARMGRGAFGDAGTFAEVVAAARAGAGVSLDLLCNLPGQPLAAMAEDVARAVALGPDQICLYHLVLDEDMSTTWARDRSLLERRPDNAAACASWLALRARLLAAGYEQRTLTNFERADAAAAGRGFRYERLGFTPEEVDVLGFGPGGLSLRARDGLWAGLKTLNVGGAADYLARAADGRRVERSLVLGRTDLKILWLTRRVALLGLDRAAYRALFHAEVLDDFGEELGALSRRGLCAITDARVDLTPEGMFYADTVAGLLAARRVAEMGLKRWLQAERPDFAGRWRRSLDDAQDAQLEAALSADPNDARGDGMG